MKIRLAFAAIALPLIGCSTIHRDKQIVGRSPIRQDGWAVIGEPTRVGPLVVTPERVMEDSRCPMNARCVWSGRLVISARIDGAGWRETVNLELGKPYLTHGAGVALVGVSPDKMAGATELPAPYLFSFEPR